MEYFGFAHAVLSLLAVLAVVFIVCFLLYGMCKGYNMEKDMRLRNRRRYF
jgi:hypothetical protein